MNASMQSNQAFTYTYSARQNEEIKAIRQKYMPKEEDKMDKLRRLDKRAGQKGTAAALCQGIFSSLVLGVGMCCCMVWAEKWFVLGVVIGLLGMAGAIAAYPLYVHVTRKTREKLAPQILKLTEELMK